MKYLIQCPECNRIYQVSLLELSISASKVRCAKCDFVFIGYEHFIENPQVDEKIAKSIADVIYHHETMTKKSHRPTISQTDAHHKYAEYVHALLSQDILGSKLDLATYLNYLGILNPMHSEQSYDD